MRKGGRYFKRPDTREVRIEHVRNENIRLPELRVIDDNGLVGVMPTVEALKIAKERELDLVLIAATATPPVAKILDYESFRYHLEKEARKNKSASKQSEIKTIRLSPRIAEHDLAVRVNQAKKFLDDKSRVKIEILLRDRDRLHGEVAFAVITEFINKIKETHSIKTDGPAKRSGNRIEISFYVA